MFKVFSAKLFPIATVLMLGAATVPITGQDLMAQESSSVSPEKQRILSAWAVAIRERVKARIYFDTKGLTSNPEVVYRVDITDSGQIVGVRLISSSLNLKWDRAVLMAIAASNPLPLMQDGTVENRLTLAFRPLVR